MVPAVVIHHNVRQRIQEEKQEETQESFEKDLMKFSDHEMKLKFNRIKHFKYKGHIYFQGNDIADFLEYKKSRKAIIDHVNQENKVKFFEIHMNSSPMSVNCNLHPETIFINKYGIFDLITKSRMPLACQFRKWLVDELLPSIVETNCSEKVQNNEVHVQ